MKKLFQIVVVLMMVLGLNAMAAGDLENILTQDDSAMEKELLGKDAKKGVVMEATIEKIVGQALVKNAGEETMKQVFKGMAIKEGATIITMEKSQVKVKLPTGTLVDLKEKTQAVFETLRQDPEKKELSETGVKLFMGKIYSNVKKLVETGSKYEVKTGSATAGVRGTEFDMWTDENGDFGVTTFEGTVAVATPKSPEPVLVGKGEKVTGSSAGEMKPKEIHTEAPAPDLKEEEPKKEEEKKDEKKDAAKAEEAAPAAPAAAPAGSRGGITAEAGSDNVDGQSYATLQLKPDFNKIFGSPLGIGLKITLLQGQNSNGDQITRFGPAASDKLIDAFSLRWVEWEQKEFGIRYGELESGNISFGHGMLMDGYTTFGFYSRVSTDTWKVRGFFPLKEAPLFTKDDSIAGVRGDLKLTFLPSILSNIWAGGTYITELDKNVKDEYMPIPTSAMGGDLYIPISDLFTPYAEYGMFNELGGQLDTTTTAGVFVKGGKNGSGFGTGIKGGVAFFSYKLEYRSIGDNFKAGLYDNYYNQGKKNLLNADTNDRVTKTGIDISSAKGYAGYLGQMGISFGKTFSFKTVYEDYGDIKSNGDGKRLTAEASFEWPQPKVSGALSYKQVNIDFGKFQFFKTDDENWTAKTKIYGYVTYPASPSVDIKIEYIKDYGEAPRQGFRTIMTF